MLNRSQQTKKQKEEFVKELERFKKKSNQLKQLPSAPIPEPDPQLPFAVIVDIDGTLAQNNGHRGTYEFNKSIDDQLCHALAFLLWVIHHWNTLKIPTLTVIMLTGREEIHREVTEEFLAKHDVQYDKLLMRRTADHRPAPVVKEDIWAEHIRGKYNILFAVDDDPRNVEMFRSHGIYVFVADNSRE